MRVDLALLCGGLVLGGLVIGVALGSIVERGVAEEAISPHPPICTIWEIEEYRETFQDFDQVVHGKRASRKLCTQLSDGTKLNLDLSTLSEN